MGVRFFGHSLAATCRSHLCCEASPLASWSQFFSSRHLFLYTIHGFRFIFIGYVFLPTYTTGFWASLIPLDLTPTAIRHHRFLGAGEGGIC
ncbi:hypothetical protein L2E82_16997 [Cichorium intybus]|uniref:Uncharacterized protein n=1 Tax=Cichorium intybus TaxID=13427 RepID=A0ACB9F7P5_CICIN|nr:hypothetical protein L2E82_16997 [Cichorium intybus]